VLLLAQDRGDLVVERVLDDAEPTQLLLFFPALAGILGTPYFPALEFL
jgi:hypothetical protein